MIKRLRETIERDVFDYQQLVDALANYRKPRDKITRLLESGSIIRIKKGIYCFADPFRRKVLSREYLANILFGPSYVSFQYALSQHGLIPERVTIVTSACTGRSREFSTPFGNFNYRQMSVQRYSCGFVLESNSENAFFIATPEKALVDTVYCDKRIKGRSVSDYEGYLLDDLRIDIELLRTLKTGLLKRIGDRYQSRKINNLVKYIESIEDD